MPTTWRARGRPSCSSTQASPTGGCGTRRCSRSRGSRSSATTCAASGTRRCALGRSRTPTPCELFDAIELERAAVVGNSFGGRVALEFALEHPERVTKPVLVDAGLPDHEWSEEIRRFGEEEDALLERGDVDGAVDLNVRTWALPHVADLIRPMQRRAFDVQLEAERWETPPGPERKLDPPSSARLAHVSAATLVIVGSEDFGDFHALAERFAREIPDARLEIVEGAGHLPSLERPDEFDRLLLEFLDDGV